MFTRGYVPRYVQTWLINVTWLLFWTMVIPRVYGEFIPRRCVIWVPPTSWWPLICCLINPIDLWYILPYIPVIEPTSRESKLENPPFSQLVMSALRIRSSPRTATAWSSAASQDVGSACHGDVESGAPKQLETKTTGWYTGTGDNGDNVQLLHLICWPTYVKLVIYIYIYVCVSVYVFI